MFCQVFSCQDEGFLDEVVEIERGAVKSGASLTLEQAQQVRRKEWAILADVLPDRLFDVPISQRGDGSFG